MNNSKKYLLITGLALGLPSTILGISFLVKFLIDKEIISNTVGIVLIVLVIFNIFYLMIKSVSKK